MISITNFSDISRRNLLRFGARYVDFWRNNAGRIFESEISTIRLKNLSQFASARIIKKDEIDKSYQLIDLANIEPETGYPINLEDNIVSEIGSDKVYLGDADLIFSKLNSHIGYVFLRSEIPPTGYDLIGSTEFYPLKIISNKTHEKILKYLLLHRAFRSKAVFLRSGKSQSHPRIQKDDFYNLKIPLFDEGTQKELLKQIEGIEFEINKLRGKIESLQSIIDDALSKHGLKAKSLLDFRATKLIPSLGDVSKNKALRIGAEYNDFWLTHNGHLFEGSNKGIDIVPLKRIIKLSPKVTLKKGPLAEPRILIDFEQINAPYGTIETGNIVVEIGSDKIELGDCDLVTNKLDPYSGYTFISKPELNMIGTTELWPLHIIDKKRTNVEYIRYLLLSTEYLEKSKLLMSGKRHPRIYHLDFLNIKVPFPKREIQEEIVSEIAEGEAKSQKARDTIKKLRTSIDDLILEELGNCARGNKSSTR